jgi:hypothetical protein
MDGQVVVGSCADAFVHCRWRRAPQPVPNPAAALHGGAPPSAHLSPPPGAFPRFQWYSCKLRGLPRRLASSSPSARRRALSPSASTCSPEWCAAARATSRSRCRVARARVITTTPAPICRTTARRRPWRPTTARSGSASARTGSSGSCCASSSSGSSGRCVWTSSPSNCEPTAGEQRRNGKLAGTRMRQQIAELDRKIKAQVQALEKGIEPELVSERRDETEAAQRRSPRRAGTVPHQVRVALQGAP